MDQRVIYHAEIEKEQPERWRAWTPQVPGVTGYGKTPGEAVDMVAGSERVLSFQDDWQPTMNLLLDAVDRLWGWMGIAEVKDIREDDPDLYALARRVHERVNHEQAQ